MSRLTVIAWVLVGAGLTEHFVARIVAALIAGIRL